MHPLATLLTGCTAYVSQEATGLDEHRCKLALMQDVVGGSMARLIAFNLGYLPGSDKATTTQRASTLQALQAAFEVLRPGGLLSVMAYTGRAQLLTPVAAKRLSCLTELHSGLGNHRC